MTMKFTVTFKRGPETVAVIQGREFETRESQLTIGEITDKVVETEQFLEKLTHLRVHIEQVM